MYSKFFTLVFLIGAHLSLSAQSPTFLDATPYDTTITSPGHYGHYFYVENTSSSTMTFQFETFTNTIPSSWNAFLCTEGHCFPGMPGSGSLKSLAPGEKDFFKINLNAGGDTGIVYLSFRVYEPGNPTNSDTLQITIKAQEAIPDTTGSPTSIFTIGRVETTIMNYPNPFSSQTTINVAGLSLANPSLVVSDMNGRVVERVSVNVSNSTILYQTNLPSGTYFYQLKDGAETVGIKKMQIIK